MSELSVARPPGPPVPPRASGALRLQQHLSRWLIGYAFAAIAAGVALGYPNVGWSKAHTGPVSSLTTVAVFLVIYPMMVNLRVEALARAGRNVRGLLLAVAFNFVWRRCSATPWLTCSCTTRCSRWVSCW